MTKKYAPNSAVDERVIACKQIMEESISDWVSRVPGRQRKEIAYELGVLPATLTHWISEKTDFCMPSHLVGDFCIVTGSWALHRWMDRRASSRRLA